MNEFYSVTLNNGLQIPQIGIGVFDLPEGEKTVNAVALALEVGYRHIDTAHSYENERSVGIGVKNSGIPREQIWITSKLWPSEYGKDLTPGAIDRMLCRLDVDYIDLLLLHQQFGDIYGAWGAMEQAVSDGRVRAIGISNFQNDKLKEFLETVDLKPAVLQVECHPYYQEKEARAIVTPYQIHIESWFPLGHGSQSLLTNPCFTELANKYRKSTAQIILRWHIQEGNIIFPRSTSRAHLEDNLDLFDFSLTEDEMERIRMLDTNERLFTMPIEEQEKNFLQFVPRD